MNYNPDGWKLVKIINNGEVLYKVFATWSGGYTQCDSWRMNSGIVRYDLDGDLVHMHGFSESIYTLRLSDEDRINLYGRMVLESMMNEANAMTSISTEVITLEKFLGEFNDHVSEG